MHMKKRTLLLLVVAVLSTSVWNVRAQDSSARAQELLSKARQALGGDKKLKSLQSLALSAKFQRILTEEMQVDGELEIELLLPDKFKKTETMNLPVGGASITRIEGLNGEQRFSDSRTNSTGGGTIMFRKAEDQPQARETATRATRSDFARMVLALTLTSNSSLPLELNYAGEAQSQDGAADVIEAKGSDGFSVRLFLDKQTHQPLMLAYRTEQPQVKIMTHKFEGGSKEDAEKKAKELEKANVPQSTPSKEVDVQLFLSDYKSVDGVMLPHHFSKSIDGKTAEEWDIQKYKVNPPLKADSFKN